MTQIIVEQLQPNRIPQSIPSPAEHSINKPMPKLRKQCLDLLANTTMQLAPLRYIGSCYDQHLSLLGKQVRKLRPAIAQVAQQNAAIYGLGQFNRRVTILQISRRQNGINNQPGAIAQQMQLEA